MDKRFLVILASLVVIFGGIFVVSQNSGNKNSNGSGAQATNHVEGKGQKGITLLEYGDYQCPVCEAYHTVVDEVQTKYANDVYFQFRNLPLSSIHPNAFAAARAAEAAGMQNKYFEMHRLLYDQVNWQNWTNSSSPVNFFNTYAQQLGLNVDQFKTDYSSSAVNDAINADIAEFKKTGQEMATPSFFLDGTYIPNGQLADQNGRPQLDKFSTVIDAAIAKKQ